MAIIFERDRKEYRRLFWKYLSEDVLPTRAHSAIYFRVRRNMHPKNYKGAFTPEEDAKIIQLYKTVGNNWQQIGEEIDRMPQACRDRYLKKLCHIGTEFQIGHWSQEEEFKLLSVVSKYVKISKEIKMNEIHAQIPWNKVAEEMENRNPTQCMKKWIGGLGAKFWKSMHAKLSNRKLILQETQFDARKALSKKLNWTFQDDLNLLNAIQVQNQLRQCNIIWPEVAKAITHALANDLKNDTNAQIRYFTPTMAIHRFKLLQNSLFNGANLTVLDICCHFLENENEKLTAFHDKVKKSKK